MSDRLREIGYTEVVKSLENELRACRHSQSVWKTFALGAAVMSVFILFFSLHLLSVAFENAACEKHCDELLAAAASCVDKDHWLCIQRLP